jgi:hypothetical protein
LLIGRSADGDGVAVLTLNRPDDFSLTPVADRASTLPVGTIWLRGCRAG